MAIKFPDSITQNNANYITVSASENDVQGVYFVDTVAGRDAIGNSDITLDNHRHLRTVVFVGSIGYIYTGANLTDAEWTDPLNWVTVGSAAGSLAGLSDVDVTNLQAGDYLVYNGTDFVTANNRIDVAVTTDAAFGVDTWELALYDGVIYSYNLRGTGSRTGQILVDYNGSTYEFTDISTNPQGTETNEPYFQMATSGTTHAVLQIVNGNGYSFKAQATRI